MSQWYRVHNGKDAAGRSAGIGVQARDRLIRKLIDEVRRLRAGVLACPHCPGSLVFDELIASVRCNQCRRRRLGYGILPPPGQVGSGSTFSTRREAEANATDPSRVVPLWSDAGR